MSIINYGPETETTVETIEYEYDKEGRVKKETRTRTVSVKNRGGHGIPNPYQPYWGQGDYIVSHVS
jgi:YD repeat-containing protein